MGYNRYTVEIPDHSLLVRKGSSNVTDIIATFPYATRLLAWDRRLATSDMLPYWRWIFSVNRDVDVFRYMVMFSIMGSPEEGLKYRDKSQAHWERAQLEDWSNKLLHRFEADHWDRWTAYRLPPTEAQEEEFKKMLLDWFDGSTFANQGIHIEQIVVNLPSLSPG
jgi:hypothetical protein